MSFFMGFPHESKFTYFLGNRRILSSLVGGYPSFRFFRSLFPSIIHKIKVNLEMKWVFKQEK